MIFKFKDLEIFYKYVDNAKNSTLLILHGWGCSHESLFFCSEFIKNFNLLYVDFPPFGNSSKNLQDWTIFTYVHMICSLCEKLKIEKFSVLGHSFGGRVAILLAALNKTKFGNLVLVDSAGIKPKRTFSWYVAVLKYKIRKKLGKDVSSYGSSDYRVLDENMKKVFCNIVNTHLDDFLPQIRAKTLIVFGKEDKTTPIYMAKKLHKGLRNSKLVLLSNAGHFCFDDKRVEFISILRDFLEG